MGKLGSKTKQLNLFNEANYHHWGKNDGIPLQHLRKAVLGGGHLCQKYLCAKAKLLLLLCLDIFEAKEDTVCWEPK